MKRKPLAILSLLSIVGILSFPIFTGALLIIPATMCCIGGLSFGLLLTLK